MVKSFEFMIFSFSFLFIEYAAYTKTALHCSKLKTVNRKQKIGSFDIDGSKYV